MTHVAMDTLSRMQKYWLITGSIAPRPIALVTSLGADGRCNAAPYSSFTYMGEEPPLMVLGIDLYGEESHRPGEKKDTLINIVERGEFVVNMVDEAMAEKMVQCATDFPADVSEAEIAGFALTASTAIAAPRVAEAPIAWECRLYRKIELSPIRTMVIGEILGMYFKDELFDAERMRVRVDRHAPFARLGGPFYSRTTDRVFMPVPPFSAVQGKPLV